MLKKLIDYALSKGFESFQINEDIRRIHELELTDSKVSKNTISKTESVGLKGIINGKAVYSWVEYIDFENLKMTVDQMLENAKTITTKEPEIIYSGDKKYPDVPKRNFDFTKVEFKDKVALLEKMEKELKKSPYLQRIEDCKYADTMWKIRIVNSSGLNLVSEGSNVAIYAGVVLKNGNDVTSFTYSDFAYDFKSLDPVKTAQKAIEHAFSKMGAVTNIKQGKTTILFKRSAMNTLLYGFSDIFKSNSRHSNETKLVDKLGKKIASDLVTIINNPLEETALINTSFDDEGVSTRKTIVVENGIFKNFLNSLKFAKMYNEEPTGSGSGIFEENFFIQKGKTKVEAAYKKIKNGLCIDTLFDIFSGADPISGDFSLPASGFLIENGKITKPVKMIVISGNFYDLLKNITIVCDDFKFDVNTMVGYASPSVVVEGLVVASEE